MTQDNALLQAVLDSPEDDTLRLVYADYLEENADHERAEFIRLQCALAGLPQDDPRQCRQLNESPHPLLANSAGPVFQIRLNQDTTPDVADPARCWPAYLFAARLLGADNRGWPGWDIFSSGWAAVARPIGNLLVVTLIRAGLPWCWCAMSARCRARPAAPGVRRIS